MTVDQPVEMTVDRQNDGRSKIVPEYDGKPVGTFRKYPRSEVRIILEAVEATVDHLDQELQRPSE